MKITKTATIEESIDKVWNVFAHDFDNAYKWMASVPKSYGKALGEKFEGAQTAGRVCELDGNPDGIKASETILAYDEENKTCTVEILLVNAPFLVPIKGNILNFSAKEEGPDRTSILWEITPIIKPAAKIISPLIKIGVGKFMAQIIEELKYFVENGTPHPRKVKALEKFA